MKKLMRGLSIKSIGKFIDRNLPAILSAIGGMSSITALAMAMVDAPIAKERAKKVIEEIKKRKGIDPKAKWKPEYEDWKEIIKEVGPILAPAVIMEVMALTCIFSAQHLNSKRQAMLASLASSAYSDLKEMQDKMLEVIGNDKTDEVYHRIAESEVAKIPLETHEVVATGTGNMRFLDPWTGCYFYSSIPYIENARNKFNAGLQGIQREDTMQNWYYELHIPTEKLQCTYDVGWNLDHPLEFRLQAVIDDDNNHTTVIIYKNKPTVGNMR